MKFLAFLLIWTYCLCLFGASAASAAETKIYKTVDKDGNVVFTDRPPTNDDSVEEVKVAAPNTADLGVATPAVDSLIDSQAVETFSYRTLRITSPEHNQSVRGNTGGDVEVVIEIRPQLRAEHELRLLVDGATEQMGRQSRFVLSGIDRGTHTLQVEVLHRSGEVLVASDPSVFHMQRYSQLTAPNQDQATPLPRAVTPPPQRRSN